MESHGAVGIGFGGGRVLIVRVVDRETTMRRASFALTKCQFLADLKDITRGLGWLHLKAGDRLLAVSKGMGLKAGEKADIYGPIEVVSVRRERLDAIDAEDCRREGFPEMTPAEFVEFFCKANRGTKPETVVTRIEFKRLTRNREPLTECEVAHVLKWLEKVEVIGKKKVATRAKAGKRRKDTRVTPALVHSSDPPWKHRDRGVRGGTARHYETMSLEAIKAFPVPEMLPQSWLVIWAAHNFIRQAFEVAEAWGFPEYRSQGIWVKTKKDGTGVKIGGGYTLRQAHEQFFLFSRGNPKCDALDVPSVICAPHPRNESGRIIHSAKPDAFYALVDRLVAGGPKVETFARRQWPGWICLGDQMPEGA